MSSYSEGESARRQNAVPIGAPVPLATCLLFFVNSKEKIRIEKDIPTSKKFGTSDKRHPGVISEVGL